MQPFEHQTHERAPLTHNQLIQAEGLDSLTSELQAACQSRGVRTLGVSPSRLRDNPQPMDHSAHTTNDISGVLLILSRAFDWGENAGSESVIHSLGSVLASLPDNLVNRSIPYVRGTQQRHRLAQRSRTCSGQ